MNDFEKGDLEMARTVDNLMKMFASNSESNIRYLAFAEVAEKEGYPGVAKSFRAIAMAKMVHALSHFRETGLVDVTRDNLKQAMEEEIYDYKNAYPPMVQDAVKDQSLKARHSLEYGMSIGPVITKLISKALSDLEANPEGSYYVCPLCGNIEFGSSPVKCPYCGVDVSQFEEVR